MKDEERSAKKGKTSAKKHGKPVEEEKEEVKGHIKDA